MIEATKSETTPDQVPDSLEAVVAAAQVENPTSVDPSDVFDPVSTPKPAKESSPDLVLFRDLHLEEVKNLEQKKEEPDTEETPEEKNQEIKEKETPEEIPAFFLDRVTDLEKQLNVLREERQQIEQKDKEAFEASRLHILKDTFKIKSEAYITVANTELPDADPRTPEGLEAFQRWAATRAELFEANPKLPKTEGKTENEKGFFKRGNEWKDLFRK